jgi:hypothetical protein
MNYIKFITNNFDCLDSVKKQTGLYEVKKFSKFWK